MNEYIDNNFREMNKIKCDNDIEIFLRKVFKYADIKMKESGNYKTSGTCVLVILTLDNICTVANLGNS